jgi:Flp pilus assembly protein TadD
MHSKYLFASAFMLFLLSCKKQEKIARSADYENYLNSSFIADEKNSVVTEIDFWQKRMRADTGSFVNKTQLAGYYLRLFKLDGNVSNLHTGDSLLINASFKLNNTNPEILYSLSQNSIGQHQFVKAAAYNQAAENAKGDPYTIRLLQFDAFMELGRYADAIKALNSLADKTTFDYQIRKAKWEDHKGNLDEAILIMEQAFEKVKDKKKSLYCWTLSNLGDMYGHAGRLKESYAAYINVLKKDPANLYCLKGIARIVWLNDKNTTEAKRILHFILAQTSMPDLKLMLADIYEEEGNKNAKQQLQQEFIGVVSKPEYGAMYNKYLIELYADDMGKQDKALAIAQTEINNRFTPETCDWLSWSYYKKGDYAKAFEIAKAYVVNKTFEPDALMHSAFIYAANGEKAVAKKMLTEALESTYELGPAATKDIREKLATL